MPDYANSAFQFVLHPDDLEMDDSLKRNQSLLKNPIQLETYLSMDNIPLVEHEQRQFTLNGEVSSHKLRPSFYGSGEMIHIDNAMVRSIVTMTFNIDPMALGLKDLIKGDTEATVRIRLPLPHE